MTDDEIIEQYPDRHHRARVYHGVLSAVEHTGDERPGMSAHELRRNRTSAGYGLGEVTTAVNAAVENGDLHRIPDRDGHTRYVRGSEECLREAIEWLAGWDDPPKDVIGELNRALRD